MTTPDKYVYCVNCHNEIRRVVGGSDVLEWQHSSSRLRLCRNRPGHPDDWTDVATPPPGTPDAPADNRFATIYGGKWIPEKGDYVTIIDGLHTDTVGVIHETKRPSILVDVTMPSGVVASFHLKELALRTKHNQTPVIEGLTATAIEEKYGLTVDVSGNFASQGLAQKVPNPFAALKAEAAPSRTSIEYSLVQQLINVIHAPTDNTRESLLQYADALGAAFEAVGWTRPGTPGVPVTYTPPPLANTTRDDLLYDFNIGDYVVYIPTLTRPDQRMFGWITGIDLTAEKPYSIKFEGANAIHSAVGIPHLAPYA